MHLHVLSLFLWQPVYAPGCWRWGAELPCVCVWRWVGYCWLELVSSSVECLEWHVILVLFVKWNRFCQLIKFGRKHKNARETWVMSFFFFVSLPDFSIILSKVILLPHRLQSPSVAVGGVRGCTLLSLTFILLHLLPVELSLLLSVYGSLFLGCTGVHLQSSS